jgi:DNA polymerase-1
MRIRRLHPQLKLTRTLTGRLATNGWPVLGIPKHSDEGKRIRGLVRAPEGFEIVEVDYSQIELRIAAHLSGDKNMIRAFVDGIDLHALTAHLVLGAPKEKDQQDESKHRLPAKAANFGYWMGLQEKGLTEQVHKAGNLEWSKHCPGCKSFKAPHDRSCDSARFFAEFNKKFPGAPAYQEDRMSHAEQTGHGYGMWGEDWYLPGVWSPHEEVAEATKRQAFALPIQSGAQRLIKKAMRQVAEEDLPWAHKQKMPVEVILQIHDALLSLVPTEFATAWYQRIKRTMESVVTLKVPVTADGKHGPTWVEQTKFFQ